MNCTPFGRQLTDGVFLWVENVFQKRLNKKHWNSALELFQQSFGYRATSSILGLNPGTVTNWYLLFRSGDTSWVTSQYRKTDINVLQRAVDEYLNTEQGCKLIAVKYGISTAKLLTAKRNFVNYGVVQLPQGRNSMQRLQEQKQKIKKELQSIEEHKEPLNKKELQEMKELLIVNMALLEVLEESHPDAIKKKEFRQQRKQLKERLASVEHALSCK